MIDLSMYEFKISNTGKITPVESSMNAYEEEINESEQVCISTKLLSVTLDYKYRKADLNKVKKNQCQHLIEMKRNEFLKLLQKFEELFNGTLVTWKTDLADF